MNVLVHSQLRLMIGSVYQLSIVVTACHFSGSRKSDKTTDYCLPHCVCSHYLPAVHQMIWMTQAAKVTRQIISLRWRYRLGLPLCLMGLGAGPICEVVNGLLVAFFRYQRLGDYNAVRIGEEDCAGSLPACDWHQRTSGTDFRD